MKIAFCTYVSDSHYFSIGCDKLAKSLKYFHPSIPVIVYGDEQLAKFDVGFGLLHPFVMYDVMKTEYDAVIYLDADSIVAGPLDELLLAIEGDHEIIGVRNNNDFDKAGKDDPITQDGSNISKYMNAGLIAVKHNREFLYTWQEHNLMYGRLLPFKEQSVFNCLNRNYKTLIIDPKEAEVYYGVSGLSGCETHWDSWKEITRECDDLMLNNKKVKVLHQAGGWTDYKLGLHLFNKETRERLMEIIGY